MEHGLIVDNSVDFIHWGGVQYDIWHSCVWGCEDIDGCGWVARGGWKDCLIFENS